MKVILIFTLITCMSHVAGQTNPQSTSDKNQIFKDNITKITTALSKNDLNSISAYFEPSVFVFFKSTFASKAGKQGALTMLKGQVLNQAPNERMIFGDGFQIQFTFKKDRWVIKSWDIFSAD